MATTLCNECGETVSNQAETCPNCGVGNPGGTLFGWWRQQGCFGQGCIVLILLGLFSCVFSSLTTSSIDQTTSNDYSTTTSSSSSSSSSTGTSSSYGGTGTTEEWYEGGDLHDANLSEWRSASRSNKLATSADFVVKIKIKEGTPKSQIDLDGMKPEAEQMMKCITETAGDKSEEAIDSQNVSEIAALCHGMMN